MSTAIKLEITEGQINNAIAVALAESFTPEKKDAMFRDIIRNHLSMKDDRYGKETLFSKTVNNQLHETVRDELNRLVEGIKPEVEEMVREKFGSSIKLDILNQIKYQLNNIVLNNIKVSVSLGKDD